MRYFGSISTPGFGRLRLGSALQGGAPGSEVALGPEMLSGSWELAYIHVPKLWEAHRRITHHNLDHNI